MAQSVIILGGYTLPYNPYTNADVTPRAIGFTPTISGGFYTDYGFVSQGNRISLKWSIIDKSVYDLLYALYNAPSVQYSYTDPWGTTKTVVMLDMKVDSYGQGGDTFLENCEIVLGAV